MPWSRSLTTPALLPDSTATERTGPLQVVGSTRESLSFSSSSQLGTPIALCGWDNDLATRNRRVEMECITGQLRDVSGYTGSVQESARLGAILARARNEIFAFDLESLRFSLANQGALKNSGSSLDELRQLTPCDLYRACSRASTNRGSRRCATDPRRRHFRVRASAIGRLEPSRRRRL